jgi:hypothetical protein
LESEITRLRESYSNDLAAFNALRVELTILKEVLTECGISWELELEQRKAAKNAGLSIQGGSTVSASRSGSQVYHNQSVLTPAASASSGLSPPHQVPYLAQRGSVSSDRTGSAQPPSGPPSQYTPRSQPTQLAQSTSSSSTAAPIYQGQQSEEARQVMEVTRGVFEEDPQLGIEFVLRYGPPP